MLRLPGPEEEPPPLVVADAAAHGAANADQSQPSFGQPKQRRRKERWSPHVWDRLDSRGGSRRSSDPSATMWMFAGAAVLFAMVVAVGVYMMVSGDRQSGEIDVAQEVAIPLSPSPEVGEDTSSPPKEPDFLDLAEVMTSQFLSATSVDQWLPLVVNPAEVEPKMRAMHPDGLVQPLAMLAFNTLEEVQTKGGIRAVVVRTDDFVEREIAFLQTSEGWKIDWESWSCWSDMPWLQFMEQRPTSPVLFRVKLEELDYYNMAFADDRKWQSYLLMPASGEPVLYGYAERGTPLNSMLTPPSDVKTLLLTLKLRFPQDAVSGNQVIIDSIVAEGWVIEPGKEEQ
jgi:hypothetical protein